MFAVDVPEKDPHPNRMYEEPYRDVATTRRQDCIEWKSGRVTDMQKRSCQHYPKTLQGLKDFLVATDWLQKTTQDHTASMFIFPVHPTKTSKKSEINLTPKN